MYRCFTKRSVTSAPVRPFLSEELHPREASAPPTTTSRSLHSLSSSARHVSPGARQLPPLRSLSGHSSPAYRTPMQDPRDQQVGGQSREYYRGQPSSAPQTQSSTGRTGGLFDQRILPLPHPPLLRGHSHGVPTLREHGNRRGSDRTTRDVRSASPTSPTTTAFPSSAARHEHYRAPPISSRAVPDARILPTTEEMILGAPAPVTQVHTHYHSHQHQHLHLTGQDNSPHIAAPSPSSYIGPSSTFPTAHAFQTQTSLPQSSSLHGALERLSTPQPQFIVPSQGSSDARLPKRQKIGKEDVKDEQGSPTIAERKSRSNLKGKARSVADDRPREISTSSGPSRITARNSPPPSPSQQHQSTSRGVGPSTGSEGRVPPSRSTRQPVAGSSRNPTRESIEQGGTQSGRYSSSSRLHRRPAFPLQGHGRSSPPSPETISLNSPETASLKSSDAISVKNSDAVSVKNSDAVSVKSLAISVKSTTSTTSQRAPKTQVACTFCRGTTVLPKTRRVWIS